MSIALVFCSLAVLAASEAPAMFQNTVFEGSSGGTYYKWDSYASDPSFVHCLDAGTSVCAPATDIEGAPRPVDNPGHGADETDWEFDIGAYEAQELIGPPKPAGSSGWVLY